MSSLWQRISSWIKRPVARDHVKVIYPRVSVQGVGRDGRLVFDRTRGEATGVGRLTYMNGDNTAATHSTAELNEARSRTRNLEEDDGLVTAAVATKALNTATYRIRVQSTAYGDDPKTVAPRHREIMLSEPMLAVFRTQIEASWNQYQNEVDATGALPFAAWVELVARTRVSQGGVLVHRITKPLEGDRQFRSAYELLECSRLATPHDLISNPNITNGIEYDQFGAPVKYYVNKSANLFARAADFDIFPAADIYHLFRPLRPGQKQAMPDLAPCLQNAKDRKDLADATIIKAQRSAAITAIVNTSNPGALSRQWSAGDVIEDDSNTYETLPLNAGEVLLMSHADKVTEFNSDHPSQTFQPFMAGIKGDIARGIGISYLSLTRDVAGANYSTMKGTLLQDRLTYQSDRVLLIGLLNWIFANHVDEAVLTGWAVALLYNERRRVYVSCSWQFAPWGMVEPVKEIGAAIDGIAANLASQANFANAEGEDAEEIIDSNLRLEKYEADRRAELGLKPKTPAKPDMPDEEPEEEEPEEEGSDEQETEQD